MKTLIKSTATIVLAIVLAFGLAFPILGFADSNSSSDSSAASDSSSASNSSAAANDGYGNSLMTSPSPEVLNANGDVVSENKPSPKALTPGTNCQLTLRYYEYVTYEEPGVMPDEENRYFLGERVVSGLTVGQTVDTWDYIVDIPNYFFFDAWPARLTISKESDDNVIEIFYGRYWDQSLTVNYYLMEGADLTADNWTDALAPEDVTFTKMASEVFENEPYGKLVEGDVYEVPLNNMYVVDSYPSELRLGVAASDNTMNVLYVPNNTYLPSDTEIAEVPEEIADAIGGTNGGNPSNGNVSNGNNASAAGAAGSAGSAANASASSSNGSTTVPVLSAQDKDQLDTLFQSFVKENQIPEAIEITDEMLANPQNPLEAYAIANAYLTGLEQGHGAATGSSEPTVTYLEVVPFWFWILLVILAFLAIVGFSLYGVERRRRTLDTNANDDITIEV